MKLKKTGVKSNQVDGTIEEDFIRYVFPYDRKLALFVKGMAEWGFSMPVDFRLADIGIGVDIHQGILNKDLKKCINYYNGITAG